MHTTGEVKTLSIEHCARCGEDHENLRFLPLTRPTPTFTHWSWCPISMEPIALGPTEQMDDSDPQHAQAWFRLTFRPLPSGYPPMNRLKRFLKCALRSFQLRCERQEFIKPPVKKEAA